MTDPVSAATRSRPDLPDVDFDWDDAMWERALRAALPLVVETSTGWDARRPSPAVDARAIVERFRGPAPARGRDLVSILGEVGGDLASMSAYNGHPRFFAYITSSAVPVGVVGDLVAAALNQNTGLWRASPAATEIELQTIDWLKEMLGLPPETEGVFSSGGQMANVIAHAIIRDRAAGWDVRRDGVRESPRLRIYTSDQAHYCHEQAAELLGMGRDAVRLVPTDEAYRMRVDALGSMIREDRARGDRPIAVAAAVGTVGTGAVDPIPELRRLADEEGLWLHIDGAYGAFAALAPSAPETARALALGDSLACDPHKWLYAPVDAAVTLVRHPGALEGSFAFHASYLHEGDGFARPDMLERSPENSRRFRALKVWLAIQAFGVDGYRDMIERNIRLSTYMERLVEETPGLALAAPRDLSIVCWRAEPEGVDPARADALQVEVIAELERRGIAFISQAKLRGGRPALRACIVNFRTRPEDVEMVVEASASIGAELART